VYRIPLRRLPHDRFHGCLRYSHATSAMTDPPGNSNATARYGIAPRVSASRDLSLERSPARNFEGIDFGIKDMATEDGTHQRPGHVESGRLRASRHAPLPVWWTSHRDRLTRRVAPWCVSQGEQPCEAFPAMLAVRLSSKTCCSCAASRAFHAALDSSQSTSASAVPVRARANELQSVRFQALAAKDAVAWRSTQVA
jgi:hypothetical protein